MRTLVVLAKFCALLAGALLLILTVGTGLSLFGRNLLGLTLAGDYELTGVATGAAIALFLPWCQLARGNILVDFFTAGANEKTIAGLDRLGALLSALVMLLLAWRTGVGGFHAYEAQSGTMLLNFPEWVVYAVMTPALALTAAIGLGQALGRPANAATP